ncbi:DUF6188 family protein [Streptomyces sp. NBC_01497]|uniref:DUF6188 family protein n=1 Tax=Streptomyces sp. NBC_01497 TaxID=2903885 RepID=UPI002E36234C|nr:DUF6188 family protein [Streptomyces sp. NBC_01497]
MELVAEMSEAELFDAGDYWSLPVEDCTVARVSFDWAISLVIGSPDTSFEVRIEEHIRMAAMDGAGLTIDPEGDAQQLAPILSLLHQEVRYLHALKTGDLQICLEGGTSLHVSASDDYEPWEITGPQEVRIVSTPGGSLATWGIPPARAGHEDKGRQGDGRPVSESP